MTDITIFGWAIAVMLITAGIVFLIDGFAYESLTDIIFSSIFFLFGGLLMYHGFKDNQLKNKEKKK